MEARALLAAVGRLTRSGEAREPMSAILGHLCDGVIDVLDIDGAAAFLVRDRSVHLLTTRGGPAVETLARQEATTGSGPATASLEVGQVAVDRVDVRDPARWPAFAATAAQLGVASVLSLPLVRDDRVWAVVDLYRRTGGAWADDDVATARMLANVALSQIVTSAAWETLLQSQEDLAHRAWHDDLTGLPRRSLLLDRLGHALRTCERTGSPLAVIFIDLDRFKQINDTFGHAVGDAVLVELAARMSSVLRAGDSVSRLAGDEFVVVCENLGSAGTGDVRAEVATVVARLRHVISAPITHEDVQVVVTASIGVVLSNGSATAERLIASADASMYRDKHQRQIEAGGAHRLSPIGDGVAAPDIDLTAPSARPEAQHPTLQPTVARRDP